MWGCDDATSREQERERERGKMWEQRAVVSPAQCEMFVSRGAEASAAEKWSRASRRAEANVEYGDGPRLRSASVAGRAAERRLPQHFPHQRRAACRSHCSALFSRKILAVSVSPCLAEVPEMSGRPLTCSAHQSATPPDRALAPLLTPEQRSTSTLASYHQHSPLAPAPVLALLHLSVSSSLPTWAPSRGQTASSAPIRH